MKKQENSETEEGEEEKDDEQDEVLYYQRTIELYEQKRDEVLLIIDQCKICLTGKCKSLLR